MKFECQTHTTVEDGGRIEMNWCSLVYEDLNDMSNHGCLLKIGMIWATT